MADAHPCPAAACPHRQPRALWMYETQRLLYNDTARAEFIGWCQTRAIDELYLAPTGLPGCGAANATSKAAFSSLITELHAQKIDVQVYVGDEIGPGCPVEDPRNESACDMYPCIRAAVALAVEHSDQRQSSDAPAQL